MFGKTDPSMARPLSGAVYAALVAVLAATPGCDSGDRSTAGLSPGALDQNALDQAARAIQRAEDRLDAAALADRLVAGREPVVLVDLRPERDFEAVHIKGARNVAITDLLSAAGRSALASGPTPVLVSATGAQAAQAAVLLRMAGISAYVLEGGYAAWLRAINPASAPPESLAFASPAEAAKRQAVACWFEGDYVAASGLAVKASTVPVTGGYVPPLQPAESPPAAEADPLGLGLGLGLGVPGLPPDKRRKLKRKEGC